MHAPALGEHPLRILMFSTSFPNAGHPGTGTRVRDRARAMSRFADVEVLAPVPWQPQGARMRAREYAAVPSTARHYGLQAHHPRYLRVAGRLNAAEPLSLALSFAARAMAIRRRFQFNMVSAAAAWPDGVAVAAFSRLSGIPFSVSVGPRDTALALRNPASRAMFRWALHQASVIFAVSDEILEEVVALGVPQDRVEVVPNGVDIERFRPMEREAARTCLGIPESARVVLSVGRLARERRFQDLVEALARPAARDADLRLVIVGDPDPKTDATAEIRAAIAAAGLQGRVTLTGARSASEMSWWYNAADLLCMPASQAGSGSIVFEAMACGLPCITFSDRAPDAGASAVAFLADTIEEALQQPWDREDIARRARVRRWDVIAQTCCERIARTGALREALA